MEDDRGENWRRRVVSTTNTLSALAVTAALTIPQIDLVSIDVAAPNHTEASHE